MVCQNAFDVVSMSRASTDRLEAPDGPGSSVLPLGDDALTLVVGGGVDSGGMSTADRGISVDRVYRK